MSTSASASSTDSRRAASCMVSPFSMKPAGKVQIAAARLDGTPAHQDAALEHGHAACDDPGILVVDRAAGGADEARQVIARGDPLSTA